jgi:hypothetical protein
MMMLRQDLAMDPDSAFSHSNIRRCSVAAIKAVITDNIQHCLERSDWKAAISEMEKLFRIDRDPLIRVRIGDARRKLNRCGEAVQEYIHAADLFMERGFVVKALAQYSLALRLDSSNAHARSMLEILRTSKVFTQLRREPIEYRAPRQLVPSIAEQKQIDGAQMSMLR